MKQKTIFLSLFFLLCFSVILKAEPTIFYSDGKYPQKQTYIFGDKVNLREKPSLKSKTLAQLAIGTPVKVISIHNTSLTLSGYKEAWVFIECQYQNKNVKGYVWGGMLAKFGYQLDLGMFLVGITKGDSKDFTKTTQARWVVKGKEELSLDFPLVEVPEGPHYYYSMGGKFLGNKGFDKNILFFQVFSIFGACNYPDGRILIALDLKNNKLLYILTEQEFGSEAGGTEVILTFPDDTNGVKNQIKMLSTLTIREPEEEAGVEKTEEIYVFDGQKFTKQP